MGMVMTKANLCRVCVRMGDWERAKELLLGLEKIMSKDHPDHTYLECAWAYVKLHHYDDIDGARGHCENLLKRVVETGVLPRTMRRCWIQRRY